MTKHFTPEDREIVEAGAAEIVADTCRSSVALPPSRVRTPASPARRLPLGHDAAARSFRTGLLPPPALNDAVLPFGGLRLRQVR